MAMPGSNYLSFRLSLVKRGALHKEEESLVGGNSSHPSTEKDTYVTLTRSAVLYSKIRYEMSPQGLVCSLFVFMHSFIIAGHYCHILIVAPALHRSIKVDHFDRVCKSAYGTFWESKLRSYSFMSRSSHRSRTRSKLKTWIWLKGPIICILLSFSSFFFSLVTVHQNNCTRLLDRARDAHSLKFKQERVVSSSTFLLLSCLPFSEISLFSSHIFLHTLAAFFIMLFHPSGMFGRCPGLLKNPSDKNAA